MGDGDDAARALRWFEICANLPDKSQPHSGSSRSGRGHRIDYLQDGGSTLGRYELAPTAENLLAAAATLLGLRSADELGGILPLRIQAAALDRGPSAGQIFGDMVTVGDAGLSEAVHSGNGGIVAAPLTIVLQPKLVRNIAPAASSIRTAVIEFPSCLLLLLVLHACCLCGG